MANKKVTGKVEVSTKVGSKIEVPTKMTQEELDEVYAYSDKVNFVNALNAAKTAPYNKLFNVCLLYMDKQTTIDYINEVVRSVDALVAFVNKIAPYLAEATKNAIN